MLTEKNPYVDPRLKPLCIVNMVQTRGERTHLKNFAHLTHIKIFIKLYMSIYLQAIMVCCGVMKLRGIKIISARESFKTKVFSEKLDLNLEGEAQTFYKNEIR